jgi:hypothetical protein
VVDLVGAFLENWAEATGDLLSEPHLAEIPAVDGRVALQVTRSTPRKRHRRTESLLRGDSLAPSATDPNAPPPWCDWRRIMLVQLATPTDRHG